MNLPELVTIGGQIIDYTYDVTGVKLKKEIPGKVTEYAGNFVYEKIGLGANVLQFFNHPEGYVSYDGGQFNYVYNYKDHLGNLRLSYTDANQNNSNPVSLQIIQEKNYYPFGLTHKGHNTGGSPLGNAAAKRYGFGGKELQDENISGNILDWYDISARNYDPALGRWMNIDPLAEIMTSHSPYNFAFNNPVFYVDTDGLSPQKNCPEGTCDENPIVLDEVIVVAPKEDAPKEEPTFWDKMKEIFRIKKGVTYWDDTVQGGDSGGLEGTTAHSIDDSDIPTSLGGPNSMGGKNFLKNLLNAIRNILDLKDRVDHISENTVITPKANESSMDKRTEDEAKNTPDNIVLTIKDFNTTTWTGNNAPQVLKQNNRDTVVRPKDAASVRAMQKRDSLKAFQLRDERRKNRNY